MYINDLSTENSNALMKAADERDLYKSKTYHHTKVILKRARINIG